jgi:hypothetical protein
MGALFAWRGTSRKHSTHEVLAHLRAAHQGCAAGRAGLSVEEAADTAYLVRLRRDIEVALAGIADQLDRELAALDGDEADRAVRQARREALVEKAEAVSRVVRADYYLLCATFGASWRRHHRDRRFAHLGWRSPELRCTEEVRGHERR